MENPKIKGVITDWYRNAQARIVGKMHNHPSFEDGTTVFTSKVVKTYLLVETESGNFYLLKNYHNPGSPDKIVQIEYREDDGL